MKEMVGGCCVCSDDRGWAENPLVYCDGQGCTVAVHQACYGIVTVPTGNWYCRKCESQERSVRIGPRQHCELCPSRDGALKRTDNSGWAHVVCALYIPEVRFGNVTTMEPILLQQIPAERFNKVCYICEESGKGSRSTIGACMQCNKSGCKQQFHVTCAQALGLLCEEAGNYLDNVKYCGYCQHHYSKLKKGGNVKTIPPYRPVAVDNSDLSSPEKEPSENWTKTSGKRKPSTNSSKTNTTATPSSVTKSAVSATKPETSPGPSVIEPAGSTSTDETPGTAPTPPVSTAQTKELMINTKSSDSSSSGKFTTSNFVESVVTPSDSVFGETGKPGKKRKSQSVQPAKEDSVVQPSSVISANTLVAPPADDINKRLKVEPVISVVKTDSSNPSVVVKIQTTTPPSTSPSLTPPVTKPAVTTTSSLAVTSSIVVSVPLTAAAIPPNAVTTTPTPTPPSTPVEEQPVKRGRSQSSEKTDKGRKPKRGTSSSTVAGKRGSRSNQVSPPEPVQPPAATVAPQMTTMAPIVPTTATTTTTVVTHSSTTPSPAIKDSPPSSPETSRRSGQRTRKQPTPNQPPPRDDRDTRFQNGVNAPHMLGNQLNPASTMAQKMSDTLNQELEAHSIFTTEANLSVGQLIGPQLHSRVIASARSAGSGSSANSTPQSSATPPAVPAPSSSSALGAVNWGGSNANITPQTLDQLLERQWEQGSQFLMEQAQHFDIASLLSCLHQLRAENLRLEEHVSSLLQRRDHLLAVNARLAIPLIPTTPIVNNIHPATTVAVDSTRSTSSQSGRLNNSYMTQPGTMPLENGPPPSPPQQQQQYHRTPVTQPSPNTAARHHSPGSSQGYVMHPTSTASGPGVVVRGGSSVSTDPLRTDARRSSSQSSSSHQQGYPAMYQVPTQQPQIVMRRDVADMHHQNSSSKPS